MTPDVNKPAAPPSHPTPSATPDEHRKFVILAVLGGVVVLLVFILSIPFSIERRENKTPKALFGAISDGFSAGGDRLGEYRETISPAAEAVNEEPTQ